MKELYQYNFPVPKMLCICEDKEVIGSSFYIMEYVEVTFELINVIFLNSSNFLNISFKL